MQDILFWAKKYVKDFILFFLIIICLGLVVYNTWFKEESNNDNDLAYLDLKEKQDDMENNISEALDEEDKYVYVDIKGAVKNPGVYQVLEDTIIDEVIKLAGGFSSNAYKDNINLSKKVSNEMVIYIYTKSEIISDDNEEKASTISISEECLTSSYIITECLEEKAPIIEAGISNLPNSSKEEVSTGNTSDNTETGLVNVNTASVTELTTLSGVGESKALKIIEYRETNGPFEIIDDIMNVSGIGEALFEKIKDFITV